MKLNIWLLSKCLRIPHSQALPQQWRRLGTRTRHKRRGDRPLRRVFWLISNKYILCIQLECVFVLGGHQSAIITALPTSAASFWQPHTNNDTHTTRVFTHNEKSTFNTRTYTTKAPAARQHRRFPVFFLLLCLFSCAHQCFAHIIYKYTLSSYELFSGCLPSECSGLDLETRVNKSARPFNVANSDRPNRACWTATRTKENIWRIVVEVRRDSQEMVITGSPFGKTATHYTTCNIALVCK